jgi:2-methylcitrate dehydratase PrpD
MTAVTRELAAFCSKSKYDSLPEPARYEARRSFLNWFGCVIGGSQEPGLRLTCSTLDEFSGPREATAIGLGTRLDIFNAAFLNGMSNSIHNFNDTHLRTVAHPSASVGAALLALSERQKTSGPDFLHALALGIEIQCRVGNILMTPPASCHVGLSMVGVVGGIGASVAVAKLLGLDEQRMNWAIGVAAGQGGGIRETHGTLASHLLSGEAARSGLMAALLASSGFTSSEEAIEGPKGFAHVFARNADPVVAVAGLGETYEVATNAYKPYPCGIVVHPIVDVCLDLVREHKFEPHEIERVALRVNPLAIQLTGRKDPPNQLKAGSSLYHWAAVALFFRAAGMAQGRDECVHDPRIVSLRRRIAPIADPEIAPDAASATVYLTDGQALSASVKHARGSAARPMTDSELSDKFMVQALTVLEKRAAEHLLDKLWSVEASADVGGIVREFFPAQRSGRRSDKNKTLT